MSEHVHVPQPQQIRPTRLDTVTVQRPRCPRCNGVRLRKYRSQRDQGDGSTLSWVRCLDEHCGYRFRLVLE